MHELTPEPAVRVIALPVIRDDRGALSFAQVNDHLPFTPLRYFLLFDLAENVSRGAHAHREQEQFLVCVHGRCRVTLDTGRGQQAIDLPDASCGIHVPPMVWTTVWPASAETVVLVLTSASYDAADYVREYDEFLRLVAR